MKSELIKYTSVCSIPDSWNALSGNDFQKKDFLAYAEKNNFCNQRYYIMQRKETVYAGLICYTLKVDLFTFGKLSVPVKMNIIGIPVSVSASGIIGELPYQKKLLKQVLKKEKGLTVCLNLPKKFTLENYKIVNTLPTLELNHNFNSWKDYYQNLRSDYRRRVKRAIRQFENVRETSTSCTKFTSQHYRLYLNIMQKTPTKLEILSFEYFKCLPEIFVLNSYYDKDKLLCWNIVCESPEQLFFFFGGLNYQKRDEFNSYYNNLIAILKHAFAKNYKSIELGQTADIPKNRVGARQVSKKMFLSHSRKFICFLLQKFAFLLEYRKQYPKLHVFKD